MESTRRRVSCSWNTMLAFGCMPNTSGASEEGSALWTGRVEEVGNNISRLAVAVARLYKVGRIASPSGVEKLERWTSEGNA